MPKLKQLLAADPIDLTAVATHLDGLQHEERVRQVELRLTDQLATAYRYYASARQQVERYQQQLIPRAERSIQLVQQGYQHGQIDYLTLLSTQRTYFQIRVEYLQSLSQLHQNAILLKGQMLSGSLQQR